MSELYVLAKITITRQTDRLKQIPTLDFPIIVKSTQRELIFKSTTGAIKQMDLENNI